MSYPSNNPWDKDRFGYEPPRASKGPLVVVLVVLGLLACVVVVVAIAVAVFVQQFPWNGEFAEITPELDTAASPHAHDWAETKAAFSTADEAADGRRIARIEQLLNEFLRCANEEDARGLRKVVDYPRFFREMRATRFKGLVDQYDRDSVVRNLIESVGGFSGWQRLRIVRVENLSRSGEALVYAHGFHANGYSNPARFWIVDRGRPLVFDWEMTEYASRESGDWAVYYAYADDRRMDAFYRAREKIDEAETLWNEGDADAARAKLSEAANARVPPVLVDQLLLSAAYTYLSWNDFAAVEALIARMIARDATPGAHMVLAQSHQRQGDFAACVAAVEKFESVVGETPQSIALRVECLEAEERWSEAAEVQRKLLAILPDDVISIRQWGLMLGEADKEPLVAHLRTRPTPTKTAIELLRGFVNVDDIDAALAVAELLRPHAEHALWIELVDGCAKQADGDHLGAATHFQHVLEKTTDEELRDEVQYRWYDALAAAKQHAQAYAQARDPDDAFHYFVGGYEEGDSSLTAAEFAAVVAAHRAKMPTEPWGIYYAATSATEKGNHDEAVRLLRAGLSLLDAAAEETTATPSATVDEEVDEDEYLRELFREQLISALVENDQALEAYATIPPADETFRTIASQLQYAEGRTEQLQALIAQHAAAQPDEVWLDYYRAVAAQQERRFDDAERLLAAMQVSAAVQDDESWVRAARYLRIEVRHAAGEHLAALREILPLDETFDSLAQKLHSAEDWPQLAALLEAYEEVQGVHDPLALCWRAKWCSAVNDDAALAALLSPWPQIDAWESWQADELREDLLAALLRLERFDEAQELAEECRDEYDDPWPLVRVHLARGKAAEASALIDRHHAASYRLHDVYQNTPELTHIWGSQFQELRRRHPPALTGHRAFGSAIVLYRQRPAVSAEQLRASLGDLFPDGLQITPVPHAGDAAAKAIALSAGDTRIILVAGGDRYQHDDASLVREMRDDALREAWRAHEGWLVVDVLADEISVNAANKLAARIAARLADDDAALLVVNNHLLPANDASRQLIAGDWTDDELLAAGQHLWVYRDALDETDENWNRRRSLRELDQLFHAADGSRQCFVQAELSVGHASERPWLRLVRVVRPGHRSRSFIAEFVEPSVLVPHFVEGEHVRLEAYEILNWKRVEGEQVTYGWSK